jgi:hypothetical protein
MTSLSENTVVTTSGGLVELGYQSTDRTNLTLAGTSTATAVELVNTTVVCDGSPVILEFQCGVSGSSSEYWSFGIWIDGVYSSGSDFEGNMQVSGRVPSSQWKRLTPSAGVHTFSIRWWRWSGSTFTTYITGNCVLRVNKIVQASQFIVPLASAPLVTSLPSAPIDGQEIRYVADATNGVIWNLRYRAASSSTYKWEFIGGGSLMDYQSGVLSFTDNTFGGAVANTPSVTVNIPGVYLIQFGAYMYGTTTTARNLRMGVDGCGISATDTESVVADQVTSVMGVQAMNQFRATLTTTGTLSCKYKTSALTSQAQMRSLNIIPIRVKAP